MFMLKTGSRPGEALALEWDDINLKDSSVYIKTQKGGPPRIIPLTKNLIYRLAEMGIGEPKDKVFKISYPYMVDVWNDMRPVKKKPHCLRHTFAKNIFERSDYNLVLTQKSMGHSNIATTSIYLQIHQDFEKLRSVVGE